MSKSKLIKAKIEWNGDAIIGQVRAAVKQGLEETGKNIATRARTDKDWKNRTGKTARSIKASKVRTSKDGSQQSVTIGYTGKARAYGGILEKKHGGGLDKAAEDEVPKLAGRVLRAFNASGKRGKQ